MPLDPRLVIMPGMDTSAFSRGIDSGVDLSNKMFERKQAEYRAGRQEAAERREDSLRGAMSQAYEADPATGRMMFKKEGLAGVAKVDPQAAYQLQQQAEAEAAAQKKAAREQQLQQMALVSQTLNGVKDQPTYEMAIKSAMQLGLPGTEKMPRQYDPNFVNSIRAQAMGPAKEWEELQIKRQEQQRKMESDKAENALKYAQANKLKAEAGAGGKIPLSDAEKAVDKKYAENYNDFTRSGATNVAKSIKDLETIASELEKEGDGIFAAGGGRMASAPDALRSRTSIRWRDNAVNAANQTLKSLFPGQISDAEREAAAREFYNDKLPNSENAKILRAKIQQMKDNLQNEVEKAKYYQGNRTLKGYEFGRMEGNKLAGEDAQAIQWAKANPQDPRAMKILELHGVR